MSESFFCICLLPFLIFSIVAASYEKSNFTITPSTYASGVCDLGCRFFVGPVGAESRKKRQALVTRLRPSTQARDQ